MLEKRRIQELMDVYLAERTDLFVVDWGINAGNAIWVELESDTSTSVSDCMGMSRAVEHNLDREEEDFSLEVASPGLDKPLRNPRQFVKNIGRDLKVYPSEGSSLEGELIASTDTGFTLKTKVKERIEGRKSKQWVETDHDFTFESIDKAVVVISFK